MSVKRKKKKRKKAEDWASFSGWEIYLYGGLDTEETAFYSSIEPELAAELLSVGTRFDEGEAEAPRVQRAAFRDASA